MSCDRIWSVARGVRAEPEDSLSRLAALVPLHVKATAPDERGRFRGYRLTCSTYLAQDSFAT